MLRVGYDLDGVVGYCSRSYELSTKYKIPWIIVQIGSLFNRVLIKPDANDYIITGRLEKDRWCTYLWCILHGIKSKVYFNDTGSLDKRSITKFKRSKIDELNLDIYVEDDKEIAFMLGYEVIPYRLENRELYCVIRR